MAAMFDEVFRHPVQQREDIFQHSLIQLGLDPALLQRSASYYSTAGSIDVLITIGSSGPLSARHIGRWMQAFAIGFSRFASREGFRNSELLIIASGTGSFWVTLRKVNDIIALPGFLLGLYALFGPKNGIDEATLRRILADQRPACVATANLFEKDSAEWIQISISGQTVGYIDENGIGTFKAFDAAARQKPAPAAAPDLEFPAVPTWRNVMLPPAHAVGFYPEQSEALVEIEDLRPLLENPTPKFRDGWLVGAYLEVMNSHYGRFEGMEGVLVPLQGENALLRRLRNGCSYRFRGDFITRGDGLRTAFVVKEVAPL